ncbi:MAG: mannonate dehydratase [Christensenellales bacterium]|nr:mannonate dehydratase [Clostridiales bacterium]
MKLTFRWYGDKDAVSLDKIRQIPVISGIVSAIDDILPGEVWPQEQIEAIKNKANAHGLEFEVVESVAVHEDIKLGEKSRDKYIENYIETMKRLSRAGIKVICYNFMPVFDWMRSNLRFKNEDGSESLAYEHDKVIKFNPLTLSEDLNLPAWDKSIGKERMKKLLDIYNEFTDERYFANLKYFLDAVIPAAEKYDIKMAIHPDDPPWSIYGLPRIIGQERNFQKFLDLNKSAYNGVTFCAGSLGCYKNNDLEKMIEMAKGRIHFAHLRNVKIEGEKDFRETAHPSVCGSLDMYRLVKKLYDTGFDGYIRPDHGRQIWGESGNRAGYGLYDRALGAMYIAGLIEAIEKEAKNV